jgi:hypothetical protein
LHTKNRQNTSSRWDCAHVHSQAKLVGLDQE